MQVPSINWLTKQNFMRPLILQAIPLAEILTMWREYITHVEQHEKKAPSELYTPY